MHDEYDSSSSSSSSSELSSSTTTTTTTTSVSKDLSKPREKFDLIDEETTIYDYFVRGVTTLDICLHLLNELPDKYYSFGKKKKVEIIKLDVAFDKWFMTACINFVRGNKTIAYQQCVELTKLQPCAMEPAMLMSLYFEDAGNFLRAYELNMLATMMETSNCREWLWLSEFCNKRGFFGQGIWCICEAIRRDHTNVTFYIQRAALLSKVGAEKLGMLGLVKFMFRLKRKNCEIISYLCHVTGTYYYKQGELKEACKIFSFAIQKCPASLAADDVDLYTTILIESEDFISCLEFICDYYDIELQTDETDDDYVVLVCASKHKMEINVLMKLIISLIHLRAYDKAKDHLELLSKEDFKENADSLFNIGLLYVEKNNYKNALQLLSILADEESLSTCQELWTNLALCYYKCMESTEEIRE